MPTLYITHGFTGSGKSTFAKKYCSENKIVKLTHDELMISLFGNNPPQDKFKEMFDSVTKVMEMTASSILQADKDVLLDIAGFKRADRDKWRKLAESNNAEFMILHIKVSKETALNRTLNRTEVEQKDAFYINEKGFKIINSRLEPLEDDEPKIVIDAEK